MGPLLDMPLVYTEMLTSVKPGSHFGTKSRLDRLRVQFMASEMAAHVGRRIRQRRYEMGLKQGQLAELLGGEPLNNQRISDWERGVNKPSERYMQLLAKVMDRDVSWFYKSDEEAAGPEAQILSLDNPADVAEIRRQLLAMQTNIAQLNERLGQLAQDAADQDLGALEQSEQNGGTSAPDAPAEDDPAEDDEG